MSELSKLSSGRLIIRREAALSKCKVPQYLKSRGKRAVFPIGPVSVFDETEGFLRGWKKSRRDIALPYFDYALRLV